MKKNNNYTLIALFVITIILAVIFWPKGKTISGLMGGGNNTDPGAGGGGGGGSTGGGGSSSVKGIFPIKKGDNNDFVKDIQKAINFDFKYFNQNKSVVVDGIFGSKTIAALSTHFPQPETITEGRYNFIMDRYKTGVPIARRYVTTAQWPLRLGDIAGTGDARIRNLNVGLGVFTYAEASYNPKSNELGMNTLAALKLKKNGLTEVNEYNYKQMSTQFLFAPTLLIN